MGYPKNYNTKYFVLIKFISKEELSSQIIYPRCHGIISVVIVFKIFSIFKILKRYPISKGKQCY